MSSCQPVLQPNKPIKKAFSARIICKIAYSREGRIACNRRTDCRTRCRNLYTNEAYISRSLVSLGAYDIYTLFDLNISRPCWCIFDFCALAGLYCVSFLVRLFVAHSNHSGCTLFGGGCCHFFVGICCQIARSTYSARAHAHTHSAPLFVFTHCCMTPL